MDPKLPKPGLSGTAPLEPAAFAQFADKARRQLRARMRATRLALPQAAVQARSARIVERLLKTPLVARAQSVGLYWPMEQNHEVDLRELDRALAARGVARYYPFMEQGVENAQGIARYSTGFRRVEQASELAERGRGFAEPPPQAATARRGELDVIVVPALVASPAGARLGYGSGFYDATLPDHRPPSVALVVVFAFQLVGELPVFEHDVACDGVVTDEGAFDPSGLLNLDE